MSFGDETKINRFHTDDGTWCWARNGESQFQPHHVSHTIKHEGGVVFVWGCMTSGGMGYMCKIKGKMTPTLYLSIPQDGVRKIIEPFSCHILP